jgi:hypothetical protein
MKPSPLKSLWVILGVSLALAGPGALGAQIVRGGALPAPAPIFPASNWWNIDISSAPVDPASASYINFIGTTQGMWPDFGGDEDPGNPNNPGIYGMVYMTVPGTQPRVPVHWTLYGSQSDPGWTGVTTGYPIPEEAKTQPRWIEGGYPGNQNPSGDKHMLIVDRDNRLLYELWLTRFNTSMARWEAGSGAIYSLDSNDRRPETWTSADAAGLAILPGLVRYDEAFGTEPIRHAFRVTVSDTNGYVYPASHEAGDTGGALPMGARLRLKAAKDISGYPAALQRIFQAMKTYGLIVADNGSDLYVQGAYDTRWDNGILNPAFSGIKASDFEVIQLGWQPPAFGATTATQFYTVTPCRVLDTRNAAGGWGGPAKWANHARQVRIGGQCGVPASAKAVALNVTTVAPAAGGTLVIYPGNAARTPTWSVNFAPGQTRANNVVVALSSDTTRELSVFNQSGVPVHTVIDVNGYFQ